MPNLGSLVGQMAVNRLVGDAELVIVDNLSSLARSGKENEAESWDAVLEWALEMRRGGRSVIFIHHAGKGGQQRGTSKREDVLDSVINLRRPTGYQAGHGAVFEVHFEKGRDVYGEATKPFEVSFATEGDREVWVRKPVGGNTMSQVVELAKIGLTQKQISEKMKVNKSTVSRAWKKACEDGVGIEDIKVGGCTVADPGTLKRATKPKAESPKSKKKEE